MKEESSPNPSASSDGSYKEDVVSLLESMQQQLAALEKKIDLLIGESHKKHSGERYSPDRSFHKRPYSKPLTSHDRPRQHGKGGRGPRSEDRNSAAEPFYERRPHVKNRSHSPKKRPFSFPRKDQE